MELLEEFGIAWGMPHVKPVSSDLWELRFPADNTQIRFLFVQFRNQLVILHGFKKKTQKISKKDMEIAEKRAAEYRERHAESAARRLK